MYDVLIEKTPDGEARVMFALLQGISKSVFDILIENLQYKNPENEYTISTAEAIALGNLGATP